MNLNDYHPNRKRGTPSMGVNSEVVAFSDILLSSIDDETDVYRRLRK